MEAVTQKLTDALHRGFINKNHYASSELQPKLISNLEDQQVLPTILNELSACHAFKISVAFITPGGLTMLKAALSDLALKNIRGQILTSNYLSFNQPAVFQQLLEIPNVDVRLTSAPGFHSKGYIFQKESYQTLIVGSSNLTEAAMKTNYEWNVQLSSLNEGELVQRFIEQFDHTWDKAEPLSEEWVALYKENYISPFQKKVTAFPITPQQVAEAQSLDLIESDLPSPYENRIQPNKMQQQALIQIQAVRESGEKRGLVVSATGTGKTYLSAFDVRQCNPKKMLFIVHREQILIKAMSDYKKIIGGPDSDYGFFVGDKKEVDARFLFATIQTISKPENLALLDDTLFDYILIDEVHKAGAESYVRVINHFKPNFLLGMTATPERTDDFNIYKQFDYNIAYEIRLQQALEEDMLCPFHYFGVTDFELENGTIDEETTIEQLVMDERVEYIIQKTRYYGHSGEQVRGLMFCSRKEEAHQLSQKLNAKNLKTSVLTGDSSVEEREQTIQQLEDGELDYILTVDIFNEGIDIPSVNQIVMLRQTKSSIIFIQQLGRGLRKHNSKEYVVIIDFIGNYKNNYMIPMALSGDRSYNRDTLRKDTAETTYIKGISSVHFEEIAKQRIFNAITHTRLIDKKRLREQYTQLKNRIGRPPFLTDFKKQHYVDPLVILNKYDTHYAFQKEMKDFEETFSPQASLFLKFLSQELTNGKRLHELLLLKLLLRTPTLSKAQFIQLLEQCELEASNFTLRSVVNVLTLQFYTSAFQGRYEHSAIIKESDTMIQLSDDFAHALQNASFKQFVVDILDCGLRESDTYTKEPLTLNAKYTRKDYCRVMNWQKNEESTIYGYKINREHHICPIFITYFKTDKLATKILYEDSFVNPEVLNWESKHGIKVESPVMQEIIKDANLDLHIFVQKEKEDTDFFYLGKASPIEESVNQKYVFEANKNQDVPVVTLQLQLEHAVREEIYRYLTTTIDN